ncbi:MAG: NAD-dependent epimerase/dehydratase family protein [Chloroflexi bacterium]|nr:NAD-dependent epimerase/dehydratase family protein [Chloroflexota bacterium]MCY3583267.1 NAD-dependent epimerase/dehydratase family protein [Chloroflexota bacterium]MCY3717736.1 NAD-dependent epimerase/dehydratase family protein [Chloroflexota bacterium]MDE2651782.1 NAD-dependent epimerase/dehydratase family protein [Chloroflexota bacterium]MXX51484.1 NAD-dependent epimerase/dehydratase family protein [Chloroflexota bacterium]
MARYLLTGGAGFLGINLCRHLLARGHEVVSLDIADFAYPERDQIHEIRGDIRHADAVENAMRGVDIVVHCAAALPLYSRAEIMSTDVDGTRLVIEAARQQGVDRFIHISSTAVYGIPDHHPLREDDPRIGVGAYGEAKILAEDICFAEREQGLVTPVIRPKSFVGPERLGVFALLYDWAQDGRGFPMLGDGRNRYQLLDVDDLCEAISLCVELPAERVNDTFNIGAADFTTMGEDYQAVLDYAGFGKRIVPLPAAPAIWLLRALEMMNLSPLYKWVYETASKDSFVSIERAQAQLGFAPQYSNQDALLRNFQWYLDNLAAFENSAGISHRVPWRQGILKLAKQFF